MKIDEDEMGALTASDAVAAIHHGRMRTVDYARARISARTPGLCAIPTTSPASRAVPPVGRPRPSPRASCRPAWVPTPAARCAPIDEFGAYLRNTNPGSLAGIPGLALPAGMTRAGLPIGLELDGPRGSDRRLLAIGAACEAVLGVLPPPALEGLSS